MKSDYLGGMVIGAILGSVMTFLYIQNEREIEHTTKQVIAKSKKAANYMKNINNEMREG